MANRSKRTRRARATRPAEAELHEQDDAGPARNLAVAPTVAAAAGEVLAVGNAVAGLEGHGVERLEQLGAPAVQQSTFVLGRVRGCQVCGVHVVCAPLAVPQPGQQAHAAVENRRSRTRRTTTSSRETVRMAQRVARTVRQRECSTTTGVDLCAQRLLSAAEVVRRLPLLLGRRHRWRQHLWRQFRQRLLRGTGPRSLRRRHR
jgi:hypothetical protein